ncbi:MAG: hypothetical protein ACOCVV_11720, partial [Marinobacter sp.]
MSSQATLARSEAAVRASSGGATPASAWNPLRWGSLQVLTAILLFTQTEGWLRWLAIALGVAGVAMALMQLRRGGG